jgi:ArsR family transcriptional regulator, arsenate/arsenite/antimonite-responsive transcriptional repressor
MHLKKARQILKAFGDDTRLRIINLLKNGELTVTQLYRVLNKNQSNLSKHLTKLRLTGVVGDKRKGLNVYYYLMNAKDKEQAALVDLITKGLADLEIFQEDLNRLEVLKKGENSTIWKRK